MCIRIIVNDKLKVFKDYDTAFEFLKVSETINNAKKAKGSVLMNKKEYGKYLNR